MVNPYVETLQDRLQMLKSNCEILLKDADRLPSDLLVHIRWLRNNLNDHAIKGLLGK